jgi:hypothetical protein
MGNAPIQEYQEQFARIEREVEAGNSDLSGQGFWRLVDQVKVEPRLAHHWADVVGRIDRKAFESRVRPRFPVWFGNLVLFTATVVLAALVPIALALAEGTDPPVLGPVFTGEEFASVGFDRARPGWAGLLLLTAAGGLGVAVHVPAHWVAGRLAGIRFLGYFLDGPFRIQPGLKVDYATYLRASPGGRATMHAAGALATKVAPFAAFAPAYIRHAGTNYELLPSWSLWAVLGLGALQILTDIVWSTRFSDWKKVRRELRLGRAQRAIGA